MTKAGLGTLSLGAGAAHLLQTETENKEGEEEECIQQLEFSPDLPQKDIETSGGAPNDWDPRVTTPESPASFTGVLSSPHSL